MNKTDFLVHIQYKIQLQNKNGTKKISRLKNVSY